jgi:hypothetical protein
MRTLSRKRLALSSLPEEAPMSARTTFTVLILAGACAGCAREEGRPSAPEDGRPRPRATDLKPLPSGPRVRLNEAGATSVDVVDLPAADLEALGGFKQAPEEWAKRFAVYVDRPGAKERDTQPSLLGSYHVEAGVLRFKPRFPLVKGVRYRVVFRPGRGEPLEVVLSLPKPAPKEPTRVTHVYPSRDALPENQLKFYLHFSAPMSRGEAYRRVRLLDERDKEVDLPFLELDQELWDGANRRFTLFFDPGRIKRGLKPREEAGPSLEEGKRYTLVIDRAWADAAGEPLKESYRKAFRVLAPDDTPPDPKTWKLQAPAAGSRAPLVVTFPESLDHGLLQHSLWVIDAAGRKVPGTVSVTAEETRWALAPDKAWPAGKYQLVADTRLEDLAGNSVGRPFEVDVFRQVQREIKSETVKLPFEVKARPPQ